ncbi:MAG TPA: DUF86 domain-containing protein [Rhodoferax sp.]|nr:DUF86 domain-containing protein [Rhodoferax sp.]
MRAEDRVRILHMVEACEALLRFTAGRERSALALDEMLLFAVVRAVEIVGEAASKVTQETRDKYPHIPWRAIVGMRNRLIHAYFEIDMDMVWVAATQEIPMLLSQLQQIATSSTDP